MKIETFAMERFQSLHENEVDHNLSESGVHPLRLGELPGDVVLNDTLLGYGHTGGTEGLRANIGALYGIGADEVLVTNGTAEANFIAAWHFAEPGAEIVFMVPNYMQISGAAAAFGAKVVPFPLREEDGAWVPDLEGLRASVNDRTRLVCVCNPNNPTGGILSEEQMDEVCRIADSVGAWVLADEVYRGAELEGPETPSFHGRGERVLVTSGLSKAYGLPGLRIGWVAGPREKVAELWRYKDYTSIGPAALSDRLATHALRHDIRPRILERTRSILTEHWGFMERWLRERKDLFAFVPPRAGAFVLVRYEADIGSERLAEILRTEHSTLLVPGAHFDLERHLRIGYGIETDVLRGGLEALEEVLGVKQARSGQAG